MKHLFRFRASNPISGNEKLLIHGPNFQKTSFSTLRKSSSRLRSSTKTHQTHSKNPRETQFFDSLMSEITEILGREDVIRVNNAPGFSVFELTQLDNDQMKVVSPPCTQPVCDNEPKTKTETQLENVSEIDVSPIVHKITQIVRGENGSFSMEEKLEAMDLDLSAEITDKVMKRCSRVPHLAFKFFSWANHRNGFSHTTQTYNTMIHVAAQANQFELVEKLVEEMEKNSCQKDTKTWTILVSHYGRSKSIAKALSIFEKMKNSGIEPDFVSYKAMMMALCNAKKPEIALEFYKEMVHNKNMVLDSNSYKQLLKCLAEFKDISEFQLVVDDMIKVSQIDENIVYCWILKSFCISGRIKQALELIRELKNKGISMNPNFFEILMKGLCRADRITDALEIIEIMKAKNMVNAEIYGIIVNGFLRKNDFSNALNLFQTMKDSGFLPTISTYTELIQHLFRSNEFEKASDLYNEMIDKGLELDFVATISMISGFFRQDRILEAWEMLENMEKRGIKITRKSYTILIKELCGISRTGEVIRVLNKMLDSEITIGDDLFRRVISCLEEKGETEKLEKVRHMQRLFRVCDREGSDVLESNHEINPKEVEFTGFDSTSTTPNSYSEDDFQEICGLFSNFTDWFSIQEKLTKLTVNFTPELVLEILRKCGNLHGGAALKFFSWVGTRDGYKHTAETYNAAIKIAGRGKDFKHMRNLFHEMARKQLVITTDTWTIMIMQYGRVGLTEIALKLFKEMKAQGFKPSISTYKSLIVSFCGRKGRKLDEAIRTFREMMEMGYEPDKELVENYLLCLCESDRLLDARICIELLKKLGFFSIPLAYSLYIRALCRVGKLDEALSMADEVDQDRNILDQYVYGSMIHGLLQEGRLEEALFKVDSMKKNGFNPTVHVYTSLMVHFFKGKRVEEALGILEEMKKDRIEPTIVTYSAMINGYMRSEMFLEARNVFDRMKREGPFPDFKTYSMFIGCLCRVGKSEEAMEVVSDMLRDGIVPSSVNFRTIFHGLNREGKQDLARSVLRQKVGVASKRKFLT